MYLRRGYWPLRHSPSSFFPAGLRPWCVLSCASSPGDHLLSWSAPVPVSVPLAGRSRRMSSRRIPARNTGVSSSAVSVKCGKVKEAVVVVELWKGDI